MISLLRHMPRFRHALASLDELQARERWSAAQMREWQLDRLNAIWTHAAANVAYYRELAASNKLPAKFESIEHYHATMPVLGKEAVRQRPDDFVWSGAGRGRWRATSGSTGIPMRFFESSATHHALLRYQYRFRQAWGLDLFDKSAFFCGGTSHTLRGPRAHLRRAQEGIIDTLRSRIRLPVHHMGPADLARQLRRIERFRPKYIYGYSRAIHLLALEAAKRGFKCDSLRVVMMTSEPAFPHMVSAVERALGAPAVIEYGSTECGVTAYEWPSDRTVRVRADRVLMETLPREDGRYDIVKTVLDNFDFPLFRYRIEDVTDAPLGGADEAFPILHNIAGRNDDVLYAADGSAVHPAELDGIFEWSDRPSVRRYRLHQAADGDIHVQIEPTGAGHVDLNGIRASIARLVSGRRVSVETVDHIPQTVAGKHRLITSECRGNAAATCATSVRGDARRIKQFGAT